MAYKAALIFCILLLSFPNKVGGGYICYASCLATVGVGGFIGGAAVLTALGFSSGGIVVGSWAAKWMASYAGFVPAGGIFAYLQSIAAAGKQISYGSVVKICTALCTANGYFGPTDEDNTLRKTAYSKPRDEDNKCENGWKSYGNNCYLFGLNKLKWHDAKKECEGRHSHLVTIDNSAENNWLGSEVVITGITDYTLWIGANDLIKEGKWTWVSDHGTIGYSNWAKGEPNNDGGVEDCGQLFCNQHSFPWNDATCSDRHEYICEK